MVLATLKCSELLCSMNWYLVYQNMPNNALQKYHSFDISSAFSAFPTSRVKVKGPPIEKYFLKSQWLSSLNQQLSRRMPSLILSYCVSDNGAHVNSSVIRTLVHSDSVEHPNLICVFMSLYRSCRYVCSNKLLLLSTVLIPYFTQLIFQLLPLRMQDFIFLIKCALVVMDIESPH